MTWRKLPPLVILILALAGCAAHHPPRISTSLTVEKKSDNLLFVTLRVINLEDSVTVPIAVTVTGQAELNGHWDKEAKLLSPTAFVLNRRERREITKLWRIQAEVVRTMLVVKEQENGHLLKTEKAEKTLAAPSPTLPR
jgi:hypothetical protein